VRVLQSCMGQLWHSTSLTFVPKDPKQRFFR
jgi:hypothetical protein